MRRHLPSTAALAAFVSAARHQSFTKAADELYLTQSAVCRQIAGLEDFVGVKLFRRGRRGVVLTDAGIGYSRQIGARLDAVERDTLDLMARGATGGKIELGVVPTFATTWLIPRLPGFVTAHPGITVNLHARAQPFLFEDTDFDAALHASERPWPGVRSVVLAAEAVVPVAQPAYLARWGRVPGDEPDWTQVTLLQMSTRPSAWRDWFAEAGQSVDVDMRGPRMELFSMVIEAARHGLGVGLVPLMLVDGDLAAGRLVRASSRPPSGQRSYRLMWPEPRDDDPALQAFRAWLLRQVESAG